MPVDQLKRCELDLISALRVCSIHLQLWAIV